MRVLGLVGLIFVLAACATRTQPTLTPVVQTVVVPQTVVVTAAPIATETSAVTPTNTPGPTFTPTPVPFNAEKLGANMDALMNSFMREQNVVGCSVAVVYPDAASGKLHKVFFNYGTLTRDSTTPVTSTTIFEIGSVTKLFTADLLALYVNARKMELEDPLQKYLPANAHVPTFNGQVITLLELATHTSALPRRADNVPQVRNIGGVAVEGYITEDELFQFINGYHLTRAPGSQWEYSNLAFQLLGIAEEKVGNSSYENLVLRNITTVLGMKDTRIVLSAAQKARLAQGYTADGKNAPSVPATGGAAGVGAGALRSTIQDMATYLIANIAPDNSPLGMAFQAAQQPQNAVGPNPRMTPGLAWDIFNPDSTREELSKDGATAGYNAYIAFSKTSHNGFVALCNGQNLPKVVPGLLKLVGETGTPLIEDQ